MHTSDAQVIASSAVIAVITPETCRTNHTDATVFTESITVTIVTLFTALRTKCGTAFTAFPTSLTNDGTVTAQLAVFTESQIILCTFHADAAVTTVSLSVAGSTVSSAFRTNTTAFGTGFSTVITENGTAAAQLTFCAKSANS